MATLKVYGGLPNTGGVTPTPTPEPIVDNNLRKAWNDYTMWLSKQGMRGKPELDKGGLGFLMIDKYRKEHPETPISKEVIPVIQKEFGNYRQYAIDQIKKGKASFAPNTNEQNFMKDLSIVDGIPGQRTTSFSFPESYLTTFENNQNKGTVNQGFATTNK